jgi:hypothetical protein
MKEFKFFRGYNVNTPNLINLGWLNGNNTINVPNHIQPNWLYNPYLTYGLGTYTVPNINGITTEFPLTGTLTTSGTSTAVYTTEANTLSTTGTSILTTTNSNTFFTSAFK